MGPRARWGMLTAALLLAGSSSARADDDRANREAEARFKEGLSRVKNKDYEAARLSFEQAYAVLHRPLILWNLALSEEKTGHPLDALAHFRQVARDAPVDADRASAQKHVDTLLGQLSRIDVQAPAGTVLGLDGGDASWTAPLTDPLDVMPGHHVVAAKMSGGGTKSSEVDAVAGQVAHVSFVADPGPIAFAVPLPATATAPAATAPPPATASAGTDALASPPPDEPPKPFWGPRTVTATVFVGAAAVAAGFGAAFGISSQNNKTAVSTFQKEHPSQSFCVPVAGKALPSDCGPWNDAVNAQNRDAEISDALYFTAGALALGAAVSWFFWPKPGHVKTTWVLPEVGPERAGIEAGGRF
jgi:hypothetical protein